MHGGERARRAQPERAHQVVERQARVDDVLDDHDVPSLERHVEILQEADRRRPAGLVGRVAGELDEVDVVEDRGRPRQVGEEDEARLQRCDQERLPALVVRGDLGAELGHAGRDLLGGEVHLADALVARDGRACRTEVDNSIGDRPEPVTDADQLASFRPYR